MNNSVVIDKKFYWELFKSTFLISAFTVGGGFVIIPLLKAKYVDHYKWMSDKEALDLVSVAQSAPGVVAVNAAIIIGYRLAGYTGAAVTLLATVMPPLITLTVISYFYDAFAHNYYVSSNTLNNKHLAKNATNTNKKTIDINKTTTATTEEKEAAAAVFDYFRHFYRQLFFSGQYHVSYSDRCRYRLFMAAG